MANSRRRPGRSPPTITLNARLAEMRAADIVSAEGGYRLSPRGAALIEALWPLVTWSQVWADELGG
jgi:DNA-binding HxlR family transcriptional regulator